MERKAKGQKLKGCAKCTQVADGNMSTSDENFLGSEKYFEENGKERRVEEGEEVNQDVQRISKGEVRKAIKRMKRVKAVVSDSFPVAAWKLF